MQFRESHKWQFFEIRHVLSVPPGNKRQHIIPVVIPCAGGWPRVTTGNYAELRKRWRAHESFIRENFVGSRMIDRQEPYLIEIHCFFHRLHKPEAQQSIPWLHASRRHLQIFVRIWNISLPRRDPMADDSRSNHVRDEFKLAPIP